MRQQRHRATRRKRARLTSKPAGKRKRRQARRALRAAAAAETADTGGILAAEQVAGDRAAVADKMAGRMRQEGRPKTAAGHRARAAHKMEPGALPMETSNNWL